MLMVRNKLKYLANEMLVILKMIVDKGLSDMQLQEIVEKTIKDLDHDCDGKLNYEEFKQVNFEINIRSLSKVLLHSNRKSRFICNYSLKSTAFINFQNI